MKESVLYLLHTGMSHLQVSCATGVPGTTVGRWARASGIARGRTTLPPERRESIRRDLQTMSRTRVARIYGISFKTADRIWKKEGKCNA